MVNAQADRECAMSPSAKKRREKPEIAQPPSAPVIWKPWDLMNAITIEADTLLRDVELK